MKALHAAGLGFLASLSVGILQTGCSPFSCNCPPIRERPVGQSLELTEAVRYDDDDNSAEHPLEASSGTIVTQGDSLIIGYVTQNGAYTVTYQMQKGYDY